MRSIAIVVFCTLLLAASCDNEKPSVVSDPNPHFRVMFYNVENLFDTENDPAINDEEFLPGSDKKWTKERYETKLNQIAKVIGDLGGDTLPVLVGLCEIENRRTLDDLLGTSKLSGADYRIVHQESPDSRGIDVALLYRSRYFQLLNNRFVPVKFPKGTDVRTREILYASGVLAGKDTLHILVNHWPSRSSGEVQTRPLRLAAATTVREVVDSVLRITPDAKIVITGDFNDEPMDASVTDGLRAKLAYDMPVNANLYDLTQELRKTSPGGTYNYKGTWNLLDHMVVSGALLDTTAAIYCRPSGMHAFTARYLLEKDEENMGQRPVRTYLGSYYQGGYSDHLPVYLELHYVN